MNQHNNFRDVLYTWFVQYNPLYFFSALCVLIGIFLISQGLGVMEWTPGQLWLNKVVQAYEILLIAGAALLFRGAKQYRPAVILGITAAVFLFDCTFRTEVATTLEHSERSVAVAWAAMAALKLVALVWAFRLKLSPAAIAVPALTAIGIAAFPQLFKSYDSHKELLLLLAAWYGMGVAVFAYQKRPQLVCMVALDEWGQTVLRRVNLAIWSIWVGFYAFHLFIWIKLFDIPVTVPLMASLLLLIPLLAAHEFWVWAGSLNVMAVACFTPPVTAFVALAVALVLGWQAWHLRQKRLLVGMVLAGYCAIWTIGWQQWPLPEINLWFSLATAVFLLLLAWRLRLPVALLPLIGGVYPLIGTLRSLSGMGWGIVLVTVGFLALIAGVGINWMLRSSRKTPEV